FWLAWSIEVVWLMPAFLIAYCLAWLIDTQLVFRTVQQRPPPKEANLRLLLTRLLPRCLVTAAGGLVVGAWATAGRPVGLALVTPASAASGAAGGGCFPAPSTLWVTLGALLAVVAVGGIGLAGGWPATAAGQPGPWHGWNAALFGGVAV